MRMPKGFWEWLLFLSPAMVMLAASICGSVFGPVGSYRPPLEVPGHDYGLAIGAGIALLISFAASSRFSMKTPHPFGQFFLQGTATVEMFLYNVLILGLGPDLVERLF